MSEREETNGRDLEQETVEDMHRTQCHCCAHYAPLLAEERAKRERAEERIAALEADLALVAAGPLTRLEQLEKAIEQAEKAEADARKLAEALNALAKSAEAYMKYHAEKFYPETQAPVGLWPAIKDARAVLSAHDAAVLGPPLDTITREQLDAQLPDDAAHSGDEPSRCEITGHPVGTDTRRVGDPPDCQTCAADAHSKSACRQDARGFCICNETKPLPADQERCAHPDCGLALSEHDDPATFEPADHEQPPRCYGQTETGRRCALVATHMGNHVWTENLEADWRQVPR